MAVPARRRPEPGEDFEDFLCASPVRSNSEPQLRRPASPTRTVTAAPFIPGLKRGGERFFSHFPRDDVRDEEESPSQALSSMVERLYDEELRKREERRMARTMEREQEFAKQAPFAPRIRAPRRSRTDKVERHLILYDKHLEMAQKRREKQEQKLRDEQEYLERHSVHKLAASSPRSPQASDAAVYQRLHEEAELKRQRLEQREKAAKTPSSPTRATSLTNMRLFQMASEVAEKRQKLQERKMKEEWDYLQMHSIHRAKSPQADTSRISQRLYEEAEIKKQRLHDMQREKDLKDDKLFASKTARAPKDPKSIVQRLYAPESKKKTWAEKEEEQRWLRERQERRPVQRRAASQGPFRRVEPGDSPKAIAESQATRVPGSNQVTVRVTESSSAAAAETAEEVVPAVPVLPEELEPRDPAVPTAEQIKAFCLSTEALVSSPLEVAVEAEVSSPLEVAVEAEAAPSTSLHQIEATTETARDAPQPSAVPEEPPDGPSISVPTEINEAASISMPTADQIKAFCESTQALVGTSPVQAGESAQLAPEGSELSEAARRLSLELEECF